ncbi:MAG: NAD-dependent epimerase/dehydratase family protein [Burkholderiales bacterium]
MTDDSNSTVLILGANGRLGAACIAAFSEAGWRVLAQSRRVPATLPPGARYLQIELADTDALSAAAAGATAVIYAINPPYPRWATEALPLARLGMEAARKLGATFMLPGNVYNFGERMPPVLREDTHEQPTTEKGRIRCSIENEMRERVGQGMKSVVIRAGDFFGAGTDTWIDLVIAKSLAKGKLVYPGPLDVPHAWAYLPDLARGFVRVAKRRDLPAFLTLHFAGHTLTGAELLASIERAARTLGIAPAGDFKIGTMPWGLIRAGALFVPQWRGIVEMAYLWRRPHALDATALERLIGTTVPATDIDQAMRATLLSLGLAATAASAEESARAKLFLASK